MASVLSTSRLHDKTVLITGASSGIGAATALLYARAGANLVLAARRKDKLQDVLHAAEAAHRDSPAAGGKGGKFVAVELDVSDRKAVDGLWEKIPEGLRDVDILISNAGLVKGVEQVGDISPDDIDTMFQTNVIGLIHLTQLVVRHFKQRQAGHVVVLGSIAGLEAYPNGSIYCATKHAVRAFTTSLMKELVTTPIRVTEIEPGMVETEFSVVRFRGDKDKAGKVYEGLQPLTPEDIAEDIIFATSRPPHVNVANTLVFPVSQASAGIVHRPGKQ